MLSIFQPFPGGTISTQVFSNTWVATFAGTIEVSAGVVLVNAVDVGAVAAFSIGDVLNLRGSVPNSVASSTFVTYTIGTESGIWCITSGGAPYVAELDQYATFGRAQIVETNAVEMETSGLNITCPVGVVVYKNGIARGLAVTTAVGDKIRFKFTTPDTAEELVSIPVTFGTSIYVLSGLTTYVDRLPSDFEFVPQVVATSTVVTSNTVTLHDLQEPVPVVCTAGATLLKNGNPVGSSTVAQNGDTLAVQITAGSVAQTLVSVEVTVGSTRRVFAVATLPDQSSWHVSTGYESDLPVLAQTFPVTVGNHALLTESNSYPYTAAPSGVVTPDIVLTASPAEDALYISDAITGALCRKILYPAGSKPVGLSAAPRYANEFVARKHFVSLYGSNSVLVYSDAFAVLNTLVTNASPAGLDCTTTTLYVACASGYLDFIDLATLSRTSSQVGGSPIDVLALMDNTVWVSNYTLGTVSKYANKALVATYQVGAGAAGLSASSTHVYVCCAVDNVVCSISIATGTVSWIDVLAKPWMCHVSADSLSVFHLGTRDVLVVNISTGNKVRSTLAGNGYVVGTADSTTGASWVARMYDQCPPLTSVDSGIVLTTQALINTALDSTEQVSCSVTGPSTVRNYALYGSDGIVRHIRSGQSASISIKTSTTHADKREVMLFAHSTPVRASSKTLPRLLPDRKYPGHLLDCAVRNAYTSAPITVTGLSEDEVVYLTSDALIYVGGELQTQPVEAQNGVVVVLEATTLSRYASQDQAVLKANGLAWAEFILDTTVPLGATSIVEAPGIDFETGPAVTNIHTEQTAQSLYLLIDSRVAEYALATPLHLEPSTNSHLLATGYLPEYGTLLAVCVTPFRAESRVESSVLPEGEYVSYLPMLGSSSGSDLYEESRHIVTLGALYDISEWSLKSSPVLELDGFRLVSTPMLSAPSVFDHTARTWFDIAPAYSRPGAAWRSVMVAWDVETTSSVSVAQSFIADASHNYPQVVPSFVVQEAPSPDSVGVLYAKSSWETEAVVVGYELHVPAWISFTAKTYIALSPSVMRDTIGPKYSISGFGTQYAVSVLTSIAASNRMQSEQVAGAQVDRPSRMLVAQNSPVLERAYVMLSGQGSWYLVDQQVDIYDQQQMDPLHVGVFATEAAAAQAAQDSLVFSYTTYPLAGGFMWRPVPQLAIVCTIPTDSTYPVAGYLSGG